MYAQLSHRLRDTDYSEWVLVTSKNVFSIFTLAFLFWGIAPFHSLLCSESRPNSCRPILLLELYSFYSTFFLLIKEMLWCKQTVACWSKHIWTIWFPLWIHLSKFCSIQNICKCGYLSSDLHISFWHELTQLYSMADHSITNHMAFW